MGLRSGRRVESKIVLLAVLRAPLVARTIVIRSFNLVQAAVSAPWPDPDWLRRYRRLAKDFD